MFSYVFSGRLDFWWLKRAECGQKKVVPVVWCFKAYYLDICIVFFWFFSVLIFRNHRCSCWCFYYTACPCKFVVFSSCSAKYARQRAIKKHVAATHAGIVWHEHQLCWSLYTKTWNYGHYSSTFDVVQDSTPYSSLVFYDMCFLLKKKFSQKKTPPTPRKNSHFCWPLSPWHLEWRGWRLHQIWRMRWSNSAVHGPQRGCVPSAWNDNFFWRRKRWGSCELCLFGFFFAWVFSPKNGMDG